MGNIRKTERKKAKQKCKRDSLICLRVDLHVCFPLPDEPAEQTSSKALDNVPSEINLFSSSPVYILL